MKQSETEIYKSITLHQRISLKGIFTQPYERKVIGLKDGKAWDNYHLIMACWDFRKAIVYFLTNDINVLNIEPCTP